MRRIVRLKREAREAADWRGHDLGRFTPSWHSLHFTAYCRRCDEWVMVTPHPLPNEIEVGGSAVALNCTPS